MISLKVVFYVSKHLKIQHHFTVRSTIYSTYISESTIKSVNTELG